LGNTSHKLLYRDSGGGGSSTSRDGEENDLGAREVSWARGALLNRYLQYYHPFEVPTCPAHPTFVFTNFDLDADKEWQKISKK
jgi:hypothetical protein